MSTTYILLLITISISLFYKDKKALGVSIILTIMVAEYQHIININGVFYLLLFAIINYFYFKRINPYKIEKLTLFILLLIFTCGFSLHLIPGFFNELVINKINLSLISSQYSMYLNFDKVMAALIIYFLSNSYNLDKPINISSAKQTIISLLLCIIVILGLGLLSNHIKFDPKLPDILLIWAINNLFFVCMSEEVIFRGFLQRTLQSLFSKYSRAIPIMISSLIFGLAHFQGGIPYIFLATICGLFYGYTYYKTQNILCSVIVHFGLNLFHFLFFTYPTAIR